MTVKQINAVDALIVRQAFDKLADSVTFTHQAQRSLRQAAHDLAEQSAQKGLTAKKSEGGREGSLHARNALHQSKSNVPLHPSVVTLAVDDDTVHALAGPMHDVIFGDAPETAKKRLHQAVAVAIAPEFPADAVNEIANAIVDFALTRRDLVELFREFPKLAESA